MCVRFKVEIIHAFVHVPTTHRRQSRWFSGIIQACQAWDPGSIPGRDTAHMICPISSVGRASDS